MALERESKVAMLLGKSEYMNVAQLAYVVINSAPNGVDTSALLAKIWARKPETPAEEIYKAAIILRDMGYVRFDDGQWYAPGPTPVVWKNL